MAFNIYKWRRDQLLTESSIHPDPKNLYTGKLDADQNKQRKQMLQQLLDWEKSKTTPDPEALEYLEGQLGNLNETEDSSSTTIVKSLKDITWEDVKGLYVPTHQPGTLLRMDDRDIFSDQWRERTLKGWKNDLNKHFPAADDFEVEIDRDSKKVTINDKEYNDRMDRYNAQIQATQDKTARKYQGD